MGSLAYILQQTKPDKTIDGKDSEKAGNGCKT